MCFLINYVYPASYSQFPFITRKSDVDALELAITPALKMRVP